MSIPLAMFKYTNGPCA
uniref:Uncharacterized protein n=1 Tax=Arundo donax TaxID=35708 RepID=A0A0A9AJT6_ARUDO